MGKGGSGRGLGRRRVEWGAARGAHIFTRRVLETVRSVECVSGPGGSSAPGRGVGRLPPPRSSAGRGRRGGGGAREDEGTGPTDPAFESAVPLDLVLAQAAVPLLVSCRPGSAEAARWSSVSGSHRWGVERWLHPAPTASARRLAAVGAGSGWLGAAWSPGSYCGPPRWKNGALDGSGQAQGPQLAGVGRRGMRGPCCVRVYLNGGEKLIGAKGV